jgi:hypothetical protein
MDVKKAKILDALEPMGYVRAVEAGGSLAVEVAPVSAGLIRPFPVPPRPCRKITGVRYAV